MQSHHLRAALLPERPPRSGAGGSRTRWGALAAGLAVLVAIASPRAATALSYATYDPSQLARESSDVVIATVLSVIDDPQPSGALFQTLVLAVRERWKGTDLPFLVRTQVRLVADAEHPERAPRAIAGNFALAAGETYLLFMREPGPRPRVPLTIAGELGAYRARSVGGGWAISTLDGRAVRDVSARGWAYESDDDAPSVVPSVAGAPSSSASSPGSGLVTTVDALRLTTAWRTLVQRVAP